MPYTKEECAAFLLDTTRNPQSGRKIEQGKATYNKLVKECAAYNKPKANSSNKALPTLDKLPAAVKPKKNRSKGNKTSAQSIGRFFEARATEKLETVHEAYQMKMGDMVMFRDDIYVYDGSKLESVGDTTRVNIPIGITSRFDNAMAQFNAAIFKTDYFGISVNRNDIGVKYIMEKFQKSHKIPKANGTVYRIDVDSRDAKLYMEWYNRQPNKKSMVIKEEAFVEERNPYEVLSKIIQVLPLNHGQPARVPPTFKATFATFYTPKNKNKKITRVAHLVETLPEYYHKNKMESLEDFEQRDWEINEEYEALTKWANMAIDDKGLDLQIGDMIVMGEDGYRYTNIFLYDGKSAIFASEDTHDITIPSSITEYLKNALAHYRDHLRAYDYFDIHVDKTDVGIKYLAKHFKFPLNQDEYIYRFDNTSSTRFTLCWGARNDDYSCITIGLFDSRNDKQVYDENENTIINHLDVIQSIPYKYK